MPSRGPISFHPLTFEEALAGLIAVKPKSVKAVKAARRKARKRKAKKAKR